MLISGKKIGMTHIFKEGEFVPVTKIELLDYDPQKHKLGTGDLVIITGKSKGKGLTGVIKRWGFRGGSKTHGQSDRQRAPGSIGASSYPSRVFKGLKMAGRDGGKKVTIKNLEVVEVMLPEKLILVKGAIPGNNKSNIIIKRIEKE